MTGAEKYSTKYKDRIENILEKNEDLNLRGYVNFLRDQAESTRFMYLSYIERFLRICNKKATELNLDDYIGYLAEIDSRSSSYQIAVYSAMKLYSSYLYASGVSARDFMEKVSRPKAVESLKTKEKRDKGYLTEKEIGVYLDSVKLGAGSDRAVSRQEKWRLRDMLIIQLFLNTGMRCSALYRLDVDSLDFENNTIKTIDKGREIHEFYMPDHIAELAKSWIIDREKKLEGRRESALFISNARTRMDNSSIARVVKKYAEDIGGKNITPHKLRATYGTLLYEKTKDIYFVQKCMNHKSPKVTELYIRGQGQSNRKRGAEIMSKLTKTK